MIGGPLRAHAEQLLAERVGFVVATVVRAQHPTSVHPGDAALVFADGTIEGFVGGTCAQSSVRLHTARVLETGEPLLLRLVPGPATAAEPASRAAIGVGSAGLAAAEPLEGTVVAHNPCLSGGALDIFLEPVLPAPRLVVVGDAPIAQALERIGRAAGYSVSRGSGEQACPRPGDAACVVASHGAGEEAALTAALEAGVPYVALVASPRRGAAVRDALDFPDALRARLHVPAGLAVGARTPSEIALSILTEIVAERHAHPAVSEAAPVAHGGPTELDPAADAAPSATSAATALDPICGMTVAVAPATPSLEHGGERLWFCCEGCRAAYAARLAGDAAQR
ncbi:MAG TPA: XdhC family protein [Conexibacter sp.]